MIKSSHLEDVSLPSCALQPELFQDAALIDPPKPRDVSAAQWRDYLHKTEVARQRCASCPVLAECLYRAVVEVDVAGYLACTTQEQRELMRRDLGIAIDESEALALVGRAGRGPVTHELVLETRAEHPEDTYQQLADRLGCSLSTIKRHLRRARREGRFDTTARSESGTAPQPTMSDVFDAFDRVDLARPA